MKKFMKRFLPVLLIVSGFTAGFASSAHAVNFYYTYANNDAEYTVDLPEAPTAVTIWGDDPDHPVPFLDEPPKYGPVGEVATSNTTDPYNGDIYQVEITYLKADREFLLSLTKEKMENTLKDLFKDLPIEQKNFNFSPGTDTLKWATLTGFTSDRENNYFYNAVHYVTGQHSIMVIKSKFNIENKKFYQAYQDMAASIKFTGR